MGDRYISLNRTSVGLKPCGVQPHHSIVVERLNRTSVGLKLPRGGSSSRPEQSLNRTSVGLKLIWPLGD